MAQMDTAECITTTRTGLFRKAVESELAPVSARATVVGWLRRELLPRQEMTVIIHRTWGIVCAVGRGGLNFDGGRRVPLRAVLLLVGKLAQHVGRITAAAVR